MKIQLKISVAVLACCALQACLLRDTQRWPGPMRPTREPLPPGDAALHPAGPEEVAVLRHADPVQLRPAGALSGHPMQFYDKRASLTAGGAVLVSPGGRAEVLWPSGASIVMFGEAVGWVGSPSRGEPLFEFTEVDGARLDLHEGDQVRLLGGSVLTGASGPYLLEHDVDGTLLVHNQSKGTLQIAFREELFELQPGHAVRIPLISSGGTPFVDDPSFRRFNGPGFNVRLLGELECAEAEGGVRVRAATPGAAREVRALGIRVALEQGESVLFSEPRPAPPSAAVDGDGARPARRPAQPEQP